MNNFMRVQKQLPIFSEQAEKYLKSLDKKPRERLRSAVAKIPKGDIVPYKAMAGYYRLRVGDYRILFEWVSDEQIIVALVETRDRIYKKGARR